MRRSIARVRVPGRVAGDADDERAFTAFAAAQYARMRGLGLMLLAGDPEGEDLVQIAFGRLAEHWDVAADPEAYVRQVLINLVRDRARSRTRRPVVLLPTELIPEQRDPIEPEGRHTELDAFLSLLGRLPHRQRQVIVLRYFHDLSEAETARTLGCSVGAVKSHAHRALSRLRDESPAGRTLVGSFR